jgi:septum formation protein
LPLTINHYAVSVLILASQSPRRRELLAAADVPFIVDAADIDESRLPDEPPAAYVERVARAKALAVARRHPQTTVLGADTIVVVDGDVLGKPSDAADARRMLAHLSGRSHQVMTAVAVAHHTSLFSAVETTTVVMRDITLGEIEVYVAGGEPMDKAGAYAIQGGAGAFVAEVRGSYDNVVGLPVDLAKRLLSRATGSYSGG